MDTFKIIVLATVFLILQGCTNSLLLKGDFSWAIESVVSIDQNGVATDKRFSFSFDTKKLFFIETGDSLKYKNEELRIIRDELGYYYITAKKFTSVYVLKQAEGNLEIENKIFINIKGFEKPAFNSRLPYIELIDGKEKYLMNNKGLKGN